MSVYNNVIKVTNEKSPVTGAWKHAVYGIIKPYGEINDKSGFIPGQVDKQTAFDEAKITIQHRAQVAKRLLAHSLRKMVSQASNLPVRILAATAITPINHCFLLSRTITTSRTTGQVSQMVATKGGTCGCITPTTKKVNIG